VIAALVLCYNDIVKNKTTFKAFGAAWSWWACLSMVLPTCVSAQDERFFNKIFSDQTKEKAKEVKNVDFIRVKALSPFYEFDLNGDGRKEKILFEKSNGESLVNIYSSGGEALFEYKFESKGIRSRVYKLNIKRVSSGAVVLAFHFYEGYIESTNFYGSSRLYLLSIDNNNLKTISMFKGPSLWEEVESSWYGYRQKPYRFFVKDFNADGVKDIKVSARGTSRVYQYKGNGRWKEFNKASAKREVRLFGL
jgi:hypothetical protein